MKGCATARRRQRLKEIAVLFAVVWLSVGVVARSGAAPCPRGELDAAYCDRDFDLLADAPEIAAQWLDPPTLVFSYTPVEDPKIYERVWQEFLVHLSRETGRRVVFYRVQSNSAQLRALRSGRIHVAGVNTGSNPMAVNCAGYIPFAMMRDQAGQFGYEMELIVQADSVLRSPEDIRGRTLVFTSPNSNSGYKAPSALLRSQFALHAHRDYQVDFSGKHDNSIRGVINGQFEVAAIANSVLKRMIKRRVVDGAALRSIYRSQTFPTTSYGYLYNLHPTLIAQIRSAFLSFPWRGSALAREFDNQAGFMPVNYREDWSIIREIDRANGVSYHCNGY